MNGGVSLEPVYIVIMAVAIAIAVGAVAVACYYYFNGRREDPIIDEYKEKDPDGKSDGMPDPAPGISSNTETEAQRYARQHNMWICEFCETMNPCPAGMKVSKVPADGISGDSRGKASGLRGDLADARRKKHTDALDMPVCIACGKRQQGSAYTRREVNVL